jgi:hypothetical protein
MDDNARLFGSLLDRATEYSITSYELVKLKAVDKTSDVVSSVIPYSVVLILVSSFLLFLNLGLALWLGEILGKPFLGFMVIAGFYLLIGLIVFLFMHKWIKKVVYNYVIKQLLK